MIITVKDEQSLSFQRATHIISSILRHASARYTGNVEGGIEIQTGIDEFAFHLLKRSEMLAAKAISILQDV